MAKEGMVSDNGDVWEADTLAYIQLERAMPVCLACEVPKWVSPEISLNQLKERDRKDRHHIGS